MLSELTVLQFMSLDCWHGAKRATFLIHYMFYVSLVCSKLELSSHSGLTYNHLINIDTLFWENKKNPADLAIFIKKSTPFMCCFALQIKAENFYLQSFEFKKFIEDYSGYKQFCINSINCSYFDITISSIQYCYCSLALKLFKIIFGNLK